MKKLLGTDFNADLSLRNCVVVEHPSQTRSLRSFQSSLDGDSSGYVRSHSATELFLAKKTELPYLLTVCSARPSTPPNGISGFNRFFIVLPFGKI